MNYTPKYGKSWALIIGINKYQHVNALAIARADAESISAALIGEFGFPKENVFTLLDGEATRAKIMENFLAFSSLTGENDRVLVFFAGHGTTTQGRRGQIGYLVPVDGNPQDLSTLIRFGEMTQGADTIPAKHILFVMDACYSGLAMQRSTAIGEQRFVTDMLQRFSRQVITAGKADETVSDGGGPTGTNSIFTGYLLEGLRGKAISEKGVITATYLMDYVYRKVGGDPNSTQTPHFGHLDGDGDFILKTPNGEHLPDGPAGDFIVKPIVERPEPQTETPQTTLKPIFAEKNGYADPESENFGVNEWSKKLGVYRPNAGATVMVKPPLWLSLVIEPTTNQPINLDLASLAKSLPVRPNDSSNPYENFRIPTQTFTTAKSLILFESDRYNQDQNGKDCWPRFLRIEKSGAMEYCHFWPIAGTFSRVELATGTKIIRYVQVIGLIWTFIYAVKRILNTAGYEGGIRYLVNLIGTKDSVLIDFSSEPGTDNVQWSQPFTFESKDGERNWKCRDANIQIPFKTVLGSLGDREAKEIVKTCAEQLGLAYNHQTDPRCFNHGTDIFPWEQFGPY